MMARVGPRDLTGQVVERDELLRPRLEVAELDLARRRARRRRSPRNGRRRGGAARAACRACAGPSSARAGDPGGPQLRGDAQPLGGRRRDRRRRRPPPARRARRSAPTPCASSARRTRSRPSPKPMPGVGRPPSSSTRPSYRPPPPSAAAGPRAARVELERGPRVVVEAADEPRARGDTPTPSASRCARTPAKCVGAGVAQAVGDLRRGRVQLGHRRILRIEQAQRVALEPLALERRAVGRMWPR